MARTSLFAALRRLAARAHAQNLSRHAPDATALAADEATTASGLTRRQIVGGALGTMALLPLLPLMQACGDNVATPPLHIAIIGGGIAGLTCAYQLKQAGVDATVYEAAGRVGGRMMSARGMAGDGQVFELGGELIDSDHVVVQALAATFNLTLDDLPAATAGLKQDVFFFDNRELSEAELVAAFAPVAAKMAEAIVASDASSEEFARLDGLSIPQWLEIEAGLAPTSLIRRLLEVSYLEEFGLEVSQQSAFNLLTLIDFETVDPFRVFGDSDERFRVHVGNDAITSALAESLAGQIELDQQLVAVARDGDRHRLTLRAADSTEITVLADHVVYALPFSVLREVDLTAAQLSDVKRKVIKELGYGSNAKLMLQFSQRPWRTGPRMAAGSTITDVGMLQSTWETSRGQDGVSGILTNFVGGQRGVAIGAGSAEQRAQEVLPWINTVFPGTAAAYVPNSAVRQHWPTAPFVKASYASYLVGQWNEFYGTEGTRYFNSHFCGEHTSQDYQGYMEGGAETGALVAAEILDDLGVAPAPQLARLLDVKLRLPQACYHGGARMTLAQRRKLRRQRSANDLVVR